MLTESITRIAKQTECFMHRHADAFYRDPSLEGVKEAVSPVFDSFSYSLFAGGKRIRPFLVSLFHTLCGGKEDGALSYGAALEMIHTFSLIHDDLPCMDDDDLRRGKPTNHTVYGEATALLAGDALSLYAFETLLDNDLSPEQNLRAVKILAHGAGICGMIAGQQIDMWAETNAADEAVLTVLQQKKTGALFETACVLGCIAADVPEDDPRIAAAKDYAAHFGLLFQIVDDILDVTGSTEELGKTVGSDAASGKTTFVTLLGLEGAKKKAAEEAAAAKASLRKAFDASSLTLSDELIDYLLTRRS